MLSAVVGCKKKVLLSAEATTLVVTVSAVSAASWSVADVIVTDAVSATGLLAR